MSLAKTILIIGVGPGDPDQVTIQAVKALNRLDVVFLMDKGAAKDSLIEHRREVLRRHAPDRAIRFVEAPIPERDRTGDYEAGVRDLNARKGDVFERMIAEGLKDGECGGVLVWGDPALYDSTVRIVEEIAASGRHDLEWEVIPGISSIQTLAARHRTTLNRIGRSIEVTTGRRLREAGPRADSVVVMLDAENAFAGLDDPEAYEIYWGAYVGAPEEILIAGPLAEVTNEIVRRRAAAREANGWIMDSYILRRREPDE
ncbi:precorrin-6A synthase (deacetylating) [Chelatococcus sambhunathii]|uniref:Precorrin-6A synthase [deacetylating] n=1 Tax=Chelatococcus sambhunathii TaxID=363953 RepID=A0ABU1DIR5_9HYPH|nr:precorrin-6A synthase (deacetylating) [Chelatococcus sambhunathii]MDR4307989.1 precorrin-6A synthase (deacetylating) [Chelatococcus sambhunathii]